MAVGDLTELVQEGSIKKPPPSSHAAQARMKANRGRDTQCELTLRRELHRRGLRYRLHAQVIPGTRRQVDIAFTGIRLAVFIDGCFWHGCPIHGTQAHANSDYWSSKIRQNRDRDRDTNERLRATGWTVIRIWEHQSLPEAAALVQETYTYLKDAAQK